jgi:8-oxo-dGTP diphosphatase
MKHNMVTAAIIINNNEILCMQRNESKYDYISYKYEFPGGKIEKGESNVQALMRELVEEMDLHINISSDDLFLTIEHEYPDFSITMYSYICHVADRKFKRREHYSHVWLKANKLDTLDWAAADLPIVRKLMEDIKIEYSK